MAPVNTKDARASSATLPPPGQSESQFEITDFEEELKRLSAVNQELLGGFHHEGTDNEVDQLREENAALKARVQELEALASGQGEELWQERQREYEMLLEEKSEVIRGLHQRIQDMADCVSLGDGPAPAPSVSATKLGQVSSTKLGQAEEILRLKRELEEQKKQLEQDEEDMVAQMRQMEMQMAKERAEMARQRQEMQRMQADLAREIEQSSRDPLLRERLNSLSRRSDPKPAGPAPAADKPAAPKTEQQSSGFFRRIFGS